jgi:predicted N-formylglutamate amidohydrolase
VSEKTNGLDSLTPYRVRWREVRSRERDVHVGVVHAGGTVCHVSVARTAESLAQDLGEYVRENAPYQLCRRDADRVQELLGSGRSQQAVNHYFGAAAQRWGRERLVVQRVGLAAGP